MSVREHFFLYFDRVEYGLDVSHFLSYYELHINSVSFALQYLSLFILLSSDVGHLARNSDYYIYYKALNICKHCSINDL